MLVHIAVDTFWASHMILHLKPINNSIASARVCALTLSRSHFSSNLILFSLISFGSDRLISFFILFEIYVRFIFG